MKKVLIGCAGVLVLIAAIVGVAISQAPKLISKGKSLLGEAMAEGMRVSAIENAWQPPTPELSGQWFPGEVGAWRLERSEPASSFPELGLERAGQHAAYRSSQGTLDVTVVPATEIEKPGLLERIEPAIKRNASGGDAHSFSQMTTTTGNLTHFRFGADDHTRLWWLKGWLFIFHNRGPVDSASFPEDFLEASSAKPPADKIEKP